MWLTYSTVYVYHNHLTYTYCEMITTINLVNIYHVKNIFKYICVYFSLQWELLRSAVLATLRYTHSTANYSCHAVHWKPSTYLSHNWEFVPFDHLHPISPLPTLTSANEKSHLLFCEFYFTLDSMYEWDHTAFIFLWLILLSIMPSKSRIFGFGCFFLSRERT